ncbi:hypothetical protein DM02DRAFT_656020 [Periconia macrospinosa]|uniref:SCP domain-containing protein n=1 Tax=Periconia macrospinosa TaxID=97972 RepID=A0A2V1DPE4_9PLEO|nr:hypothetical protein DM02DRAFT_656020 [Periconia macrospinosa]
MQFTVLLTTALLVVSTSALPTTTEPVTLIAPAVAEPKTLDTRDIDYLTIVNKWRQTMNVPALQLSSTLEWNALKTVNAANGQLVHKLYPGTLAQVLAQGQEGDFESVFVGGWICEIPSLIGGSENCAKWVPGWIHAGQTDHAKIVSSTKYTAIGCWNTRGIWGCDLGNA